jgi:transaldolase
MSDMAEANLAKLSRRGQSVWIDSLSRTMLETGKLKKLMDEDSVVGVTTNPTIFQKAIAEGEAYDEQLRELLGHESDPKEIFLQLSARDVEAALELLSGVHEQNPEDGFVSWEVDPTLAYDREGTFDEAMRLHAWLDRPNLYVKIPATKPGLGAIEDSIAHGKSINVTLIFSLQRYREVVEAYLRGLERLVASGGDPSKVHSVASFFVSRVDTEADKRLEAIGTKEALALRGKLAIANAKLAYEHYEQIFDESNARWSFLAGKGAWTQRCLWASTSTKNPEYRDVLYVEELIGPNTVDTMPLETVAAFQDHGEVRGDTVKDDVAGAHALFDEIAAAGVDVDDVTLTLELEGVQKFADSFEELLDGVRAKHGELATA